MQNVCELDCRAEFDRNRLAWQNLLLQAESFDIFASPDWVLTMFDAAEGTVRPRVFLVNGGARPIGLMPLLEYKFSTRLSTSRILSSLPAPRGHLFRPPGTQPAATFLALFRFLANYGDTWDEIRLTGIDPASPESRRLQTTLDVTRLRHEVTEGATLYALDLSHTLIEPERCEPLLASSGLRYEHHRTTLERSSKSSDFPAFDDYMRYADESLVIHAPYAQNGDAKACRQVLRQLDAIARDAEVADLHLLWRQQNLVGIHYNTHDRGHVQTIFTAAIAADVGRDDNRCFASTVLQRCQQLNDQCIELHDELEYAPGIQPKPCTRLDFQIFSPRRRMLSGMRRRNRRVQYR